MMGPEADMEFRKEDLAVWLCLAISDINWDIRYLRAKLDLVAPVA